MDILKFYNRTKEIDLLKNIKSSQIAIIGRRRIGKTRLIKEVYGNRLLYFFFAAEKTEKEIINNWVDDFPDKNLPRVNTFNEFFKLVFNYKNEMIFFFDEFQNILKVNKSFIYDLQKLIDEIKPNLIITGSFISMMKKIVEDYKSPLYGRFDLIIHLEELSLKVVLKILSDLHFNFEDSLKFYYIFGGIPKYYELIKKNRNIDLNSFINNLFVEYPRPLNLEVKTMLKEEFGSEQKIFFSILNSIAQGKNSLKEISDFTGIKPTNLTKYISLLKEDFNIIERITTLIGSTKKGIYKINSNLFEFWFFLIWRREDLLKSNLNNFKSLFNSSLNQYFGFKFEDVCREFVLDNFNYSKIGSQWGKYQKRVEIGDGRVGSRDWRFEKRTFNYEIDICGINEEKNKILFGECKWQENVDASKILRELKEKSQYVKWKGDIRNETGDVGEGIGDDRIEEFVIFAKSFKGFRDGRLEIEEWRLENGENRVVSREIWEKENNCKLYDLNDLEKVFRL